MFFFFTVWCFFFYLLFYILWNSCFFFSLSFCVCILVVCSYCINVYFSLCGVLLFFLIFSLFLLTFIFYCFFFPFFFLCRVFIDVYLFLLRSFFSFFLTFLSCSYWSLCFYCVVSCVENFVTIACFDKNDILAGEDIFFFYHIRVSFFIFIVFIDLTCLFYDFLNSVPSVWVHMLVRCHSIRFCFSLAFFDIQLSLFIFCFFRFDIV